MTFLAPLVCVTQAPDPALHRLLCCTVGRGARTRSAAAGSVPTMPPEVTEAFVPMLDRLVRHADPAGACCYGR
eukprot:2957055-Prymnesium_polylepis.1